MERVDVMRMKTILEILKSSPDVTYYKIASTGLKEVPKALQDMKKYIETNTRKPKEVLIVVSIK